MILADTSVWIDHLRRSDPRLTRLLLQRQIVMHTMVAGELACGSLKDRNLALHRWLRLPRLNSVSDEAAMQFLERHGLMGRGIGFVDVHLLAAVTAGSDARLWTSDRRLAEVAHGLGLAIDT